MAQLNNLTRADVVKPVFAYITDANPLKFKYILPTTTVGKRSVLVKDLRHARMINSLLAQQLMEDGLVKEVTLASTPVGGVNRDLVIVEYKNAESCARGRAMHEQSYLNFAANVKADGTLVNPLLSLWPVEEPMPTQAEFKAMTIREFHDLQTQATGVSGDELIDMAVVKAAVKVFASRTSKAHGGDIKIAAYPKNNNGTLKVEFTHACVTCKSGRENTRSNMEKMMPQLTQGLVNKVLVV